MKNEIEKDTQSLNPGPVPLGHGAVLTGHELKIIRKVVFEYKFKADFKVGSFGPFRKREPANPTNHPPPFLDETGPGQWRITPNGFCATCKAGYTVQYSNTDSDIPCFTVYLHC
jgi:hypothetical protein